MQHQLFTLMLCRDFWFRFQFVGLDGIDSWGPMPELSQQVRGKWKPSCSRKQVVRICWRIKNWAESNKGFEETSAKRSADFEERRNKQLTLTLRRLISYIYMEHPFLMYLDHTQRRSIVGRTPLDEWSARRRDLYLTTHNIHNRQTFMSSAGFKTAIPTGEWPQTHALDRSATGIGDWPYALQPNIWLVPCLKFPTCSRTSHLHDITANFHAVAGRGLSFIDV